MTTEYSVELCKTLERKFHSAGLHRPMKTTRYDPGTELVYDITSIENANKGRVHLVVEKFVGGGFAGQVYQVKITEIIAENGPLKGLEAGGIYAIKAELFNGSKRFLKVLLFFAREPNNQIR